MKNDGVGSAGRAYTDNGNTVCRFSVTKAGASSVPELRETLDVACMQDLTFSCRTKQSGGTTSQVALYMDGSLREILASTTSTEWINIRIVFNLEAMTYTATVGGDTVALNTPIGDIYDSTTFTLSLRQIASATKNTYWDNILITSETVIPIVTKDKSEWFAWTIPNEKKAKGTAIDASFMLDKPAGKHGFVQVDGDRFVFEDGTPARFWGTNVVYNAGLMQPKDAETLADRIARCGYNIVRLHMLDDNTHDPNIFKSGTTRELDEESLDRLFYFTSLLKERGIYIYMDLLVYRRATESDGIEAAEDIDNKGWQSEAHYDDYLLQLQQEYAQQLLTRQNPYTGLSYAQDPQMAMIGITNEGSVLGIMGRRTLYPTTAYYQGVLNGKFNTWLRERYASTDALRTAWAESGKTGLMDSENLEAGTVDVQREISNADLFSARRRLDTNKFLIGLEKTFYTKMRTYLRNTLGVKCPCTGTSLGGGDGTFQSNLYANAKMTDYVARNAYYGKNVSMLYNGSLVEFISSSRAYGKPYIITEWNCFEPSTFVAESTLLMSTYAQYQGWNMIRFQMWHTANLPGKQSAIASPYAEYQHPVYTALAPATGQNFLRGDVIENTMEYYYPKTYDDAIDPNAMRLPTIQNTGIYAKSGYMYEDVAQAPAAADPEMLDTIESKRAGADAAQISEQIYWDTASADFHLQTEYTQGIAGYHTEPTSLKYVTFDLDNTYYTAILNSMTEETIPNSDRLLLSVASHCENTDREVSPTYGTIISNGKGPVLVEPVTGSVTVKLNRDLLVFALDANGARKERVPVTEDENGYKTFELTSAQQTLNYEICTTALDGSATLTAEITNASVSGSSVSFKVTNTGYVSEGAVLLVAAAYKGTSLVDMRLCSVSQRLGKSGDYTVTFADKQFDRVVLFGVTDLQSMRLTAPAVTAVR